MSFYSTRGGACVTASQAILWGLAKDGGLYVPSMFPLLPEERIFGFCDLSYQSIAERILGAFLEDYSKAEIREAVQAAYSPENFDDPAIVPLKSLDDRVQVMELFHGPTLAFKDIALKLLPYLDPDGGKEERGNPRNQHYGRHQRRYGQGGAGRLPRRGRHQLHRVLPP